MSNNLKKYKGLYNDVNDYSMSFKIGHGYHFQLEPGEFRGEICQVVSDNVIACTLQSNRTLLEVGNVLDGFTLFLLPGNMEQGFNWRKQRLTGQRIGLLKSQMPHIAIIPSNFFGTPIALRNDFLKKLIVELNFNETLYQNIQKTEVVELQFDEAIRIQNLVKELCASDQPDEKTLSEELPVLLLEAIEKTSGQLPVNLSGTREQTFGRIIHYIEENLTKKISTKMLYESVEISERNLRYLFRDLTGLSPMKFIKSLRLNMARKEIKKSDQKAAISRIATAWGFNHSGQFATDYKMLFGEYPSNTARRKK